MSRISEVLGRIQTVREYTVSLVDAVPESEWFRQPTEGVTHVAWQVGHLAMAQYRLALDLVRGVQPGDDELISARMLEIYGKDSIPDPDPSANAAPEEIRAAFTAALQPTLLRFTSAFQKASPLIDPEEVIWRTQFLVGAMAHTMLLGQSFPIEAARRTNPLDLLEALITFGTAGFKAVQSQSPAASAAAQA